MSKWTLKSLVGGLVLAAAVIAPTAAMAQVFYGPGPRPYYYRPYRPYPYPYRYYGYYRPPVVPVYPARSVSGLSGAGRAGPGLRSGLRRGHAGLRHHGRQLSIAQASRGLVHFSAARHATSRGAGRKHGPDPLALPRKSSANQAAPHIRLRGRQAHWADESHRSPCRSARDGGELGSRNAEVGMPSDVAYSRGAGAYNPAGRGDVGLLCAQACWTFPTRPCGCLWFLPSLRQPSANSSRRRPSIWNGPRF